MIEAYITNPGKYVCGDLCGEYLKLPAAKEDVKALLSRIGVDGVLYEEYLITDYRTDVKGLSGCLGGHENIDELNYLAVLLSGLDERDLEKYKAALACDDYYSNAHDLINLTRNLDSYDWYPDIKSHEDLGRYYIEDLIALKTPDDTPDYFDYVSYGRDVATGEGGVFTDSGYIALNGNEYTESYGGRGDIPDEYRVFAYPDPPARMPIKQQLEMYAKMITAPVTGKLTPARAERT